MKGADLTNGSDAEGKAKNSGEQDEQGEMHDPAGPIDEDYPSLGLKAPALRTYDPEPEREQSRRWLAYALVILLCATVIASFVSLWLLDQDGFINLKALLELVFAPIITLVGTATGFYFGGRSAPSAGNNSEEG